MRGTSEWQSGSILVSAILVLLLMTILGIGLTHSVSLRLKNSAAQGDVNAAISAAESCVFEQISWLAAQRARPVGNNLNQIVVNRNALQGLAALSQDITDAISALDEGYSYQCDIDSINGRCTSTDTSGVGGNVGSVSPDGRRFCYVVSSRGAVGARSVDLLVTLTKGF